MSTFGLTEVTLTLGLLIATPILIAALGEAICERAGVLNIGLEGIMEWGALVGFVAVTITGSVGLGFVMAALAGIILGLVVAALTVTLSTNQFYTGIVIWIFSLGATGFVHRLGFWHASTIDASFLNMTVPFFSEIPLIGPALFDTNIVTYMALLLALVVWILFSRTKLGLWITAAGHRPEALEAVAISPIRVRYLCLIVCSVLGAVAGAYISVVATGLYYSAGFFEGIVGGRGWMAIIVVNFGSWHAPRILFGAILIGVTWAAQLRLQMILKGYPVQMFMMLPYLVAGAFMFLGRVNFPGALGRPYIRRR